jgi:hypothetical protein
MKVRRAEALGGWIRLRPANTPIFIGGKGAAGTSRGCPYVSANIGLGEARNLPMAESTYGGIYLWRRGGITVRRRFRCQYPQKSTLGLLRIASATTRFDLAAHSARRFIAANGPAELATGAKGDFR